MSTAGSNARIRLHLNNLVETFRLVGQVHHLFGHMPPGDRPEGFREWNDRRYFQTQVYGSCYAFCGHCGFPLEPAEKGPGADEPGYAGFRSCCERGCELCGVGTYPFHQRVIYVRGGYHALLDGDSPTERIRHASGNLRFCISHFSSVAQAAIGPRNFEALRDYLDAIDIAVDDLEDVDD